MLLAPKGAKNMLDELSGSMIIFRRLISVVVIIKLK
jgi:hypothetical protein